MQINAMLDAVKRALGELNLKLQVVYCIGGDKVTEDRILKQTTGDKAGKFYKNVRLHTGHSGDATLLQLLTDMGLYAKLWVPNKQHYSMCKTCTDKPSIQGQFLLECSYD